MDLLVKKNNDLENEPQKARTILQKAKSEPEANLAETNTRLKTDLQKARAMWKEEEESQAGEFEDLAKKNVDLTNQFRRIEVERK